MDNGPSDIFNVYQVVGKSIFACLFSLCNIIRLSCHEPYFRKHIGIFVNVIKILQRFYRFLIFLGINLLSLSKINNSLLIPANVAICFPTVFRIFFLFTIATPDRSFLLSERSFKGHIDSPK